MATAPPELVIWNFPHSDKFGGAGRLLKSSFLQLRKCINAGLLAAQCRVEMRLREIESEAVLMRSAYLHEEAATAAGFMLVSVMDSDMEQW